MFDFMKSFANMPLGDPTAMAPKGPEGWQTAVQPEGSAMATTPEGAFAGYNPKVSDVGQAMKAAGGAMPGGQQTMWGNPVTTDNHQSGNAMMMQPRAMDPSQSAGSAPQAQRPKKMGAFALGDPQQSSGPAAWLKPFGGM